VLLVMAVLVGLVHIVLLVMAVLVGLVHIVLLVMAVLVGLVHIALLVMAVLVLACTHSGYVQGYEGLSRVDRCCCTVGYDVVHVQSGRRQVGASDGYCWASACVDSSPPVQYSP
jgi:hypothetical protein